MSNSNNSINSKDKLKILFDLVREKSRMLRQRNPKADGLAFWQPIKSVLSKYTYIRASKFKDMDSEKRTAIMELPEKTINGFGKESTIEVHHFMIQAVRIPIKEEPTLQKILQIALNLGQYEGTMEGRELGCHPPVHSGMDEYIRSLTLEDYVSIDDIKEMNKIIPTELVIAIKRIF